MGRVGPFLGQHSSKGEDNTPQLPTCARGCLAGKVAGCRDISMRCVCGSEAFLYNVEACIGAACVQGDDRSAARRWIRVVCADPDYVNPNEPNKIINDLRNIEIRDLVKRQGSFSFSRTTTRRFSDPITGFPTPTGLDASETVPTGPAETTSPGGASNGDASGDSGSGGRGLSSSAKVGVGLGVPLGLILIGALIYLGFWFGKRQRKAKAQEDSGAGAAQTVEEKPGVVSGGPQGGMIVEADGRGYLGHEMATQSNIAELPGGEYRLPQSDRGVNAGHGRAEQAY